MLSLAHVRSSHAGSTGRCNTGVKSLCWGFKLQGLTWSFVYTDWMKGLMTIMPDGSYEVKSFATDTERNNVAAYGVFSGTHTGPGGPCEPTGKRTTSDYVYVMQFTGDKISHMTKIWHSGMALEELGWA